MSTKERMNRLYRPNELGGFGPPSPFVPPQPAGESYRGFALFTPGESGLQRLSEHWCLSRDGDALCYALYRRHYSSSKNKRPKIRQFAAPGERLILLGTDGLALFVWTKQQYRADAQLGVNCAVFRNEGGFLSSDLIKEASALAWEKWPGQRLFTFIDARQVRHKRDPGRCFKKAGWIRDGQSKSGLLIFATEAINANPPLLRPAEAGGFRAGGIL